MIVRYTTQGVHRRMADVNVIVVEDDPRYRASLEALLNHTPGFAVAGSFHSALDAVAALDDGIVAAWDLVFMDIDIANGIDATRRLKHRMPTLPIVMMTVFEEPAAILRAIRAGADGYLLKKSSAHDIIAQARKAVAGGASMTPAVARSVLDVMKPPGRFAPSERERDVLRGLVEGLGDGELAAELDIDVAALHGHIRQLYVKLRAHG